MNHNYINNEINGVTTKVHVVRRRKNKFLWWFTAAAFSFGIIFVIRFVQTNVSNRIYDNDEGGMITTYNEMHQSYDTEWIDASRLMVEKAKEMPKQATTCVLTISALNDFGFVLTLHESIVMNSPSIDCFVWFVGDMSDPVDELAVKGLQDIQKVLKKKKNFEMVFISDMDKAMKNFHGASLAFKFNSIELQSTLKPFAFQYTLDVVGADAAIYLDNDIWVTSSLEEIQNELLIRSAIVTPHCLTPIPEDGRKQRDIDILGSGVFNFGFVAFSKTEHTDNFLQWWGERLSLFGFANLEKSMFYDQNWGMFIPAYFDHEDYYVLRDSRYNIAYWNLHERGEDIKLDQDGYVYTKDRITNKDERVVFINFSGMILLEEIDRDFISRNQDRYTLEDFPHLEEVMDAYIDILSSHNTLLYRNIPYGYNNFTDGSTIEQWMRDIYAAVTYPVDTTSYLIAEEEPPYDTSISPYTRASFIKNIFDNPFCALKSCLTDESKALFQDWMWHITPDKPVDMEGDYYFSFFEKTLWESRRDLMMAFPHPEREDYDRFKEWMIHSEEILPSTHERWIKELEFN